MKIRSGFVSNSSSSSFTCDVCGNTESGYDASLSDLGMAECSAGHCFCEDHSEGIKISNEKAFEWIKKQIQGMGSWVSDEEKSKMLSNAQTEFDSGNVQDILSEYEEDGCCPERCPVCSLKNVSHDDMVKYLLKNIGKTDKEVKQEIKSKFSSYEEFKNSLK